MKFFLTTLFTCMVWQFHAQASCIYAEGGCEINKTLDDKFESIIIKASMVLNDEGIDTLEDYAKIKVNSLDDDYELLFNQYFMAGTWKPFKETIPLANYWRSNSRFDNHSSLAVLLMMNHESKNLFTNDELLTLRILGHNTRQENLSVFDLSRQVVKLTGGIQGDRDISLDEANHVLSSLENLKCNLSTEFMEDLYEEVNTRESDLNFENGKLYLDDEIQMSVPSFARYNAPILEREIEDDRNHLDIAATYRRNENFGLKAIKFYHENYNFNDYVVIDKQKSEVSIFNQGVLKSKFESHFELDDRSSRGGAGIYYLSKQNELFDESGDFKKSLSTQIELEDNTRIYILPSDSKTSNFHIKNHRLMFNSFEDKKSYSAFNYSNKDKYVINSDFIVPASSSSFKKDFVAALEDEKEKLMEIYKMDSDTYNELARFSYGIMGIESKFGESLKYKIKQSLPYIVSIAKGNGFDTSRNSRGPTQIKKIPVLIEDNYGIKKEDLSNPRDAAITTLGFAYEILQDLKRLSHHHPDINSKNIFDYLYYMYQGKRSEIIKATATPDKSIRIKMIKEAYKELEIIDYL